MPLIRGVIPFILIMKKNGTTFKLSSPSGLLAIFGFLDLDPIILRDWRIIEANASTGPQLQQQRRICPRRRNHRSPPPDPMSAEPWMTTYLNLIFPFMLQHGRINRCVGVLYLSCSSTVLLYDTLPTVASVRYIYICTWDSVCHKGPRVSMWVFLCMYMYGCMYVW